MCECNKDAFKFNEMRSDENYPRKMLKKLEMQPTVLTPTNVAALNNCISHFNWWKQQSANPNPAETRGC